MEELKIGDICKVIDAGLLYVSFKDFALSSGYPEIIDNMYVNRHNPSVVLNKEIVVLYIGRHNYECEKLIAIVETIDSPLYLKYMISVDGLVVIREANADIFLQTYLLGKPLTRTVPDYYVSELLIESIINKNPLDLLYIKPSLLTDKHYKRVLRKDGGLLGLIPEERRTIELCTVAIRDEAYAEKFIPIELRSLVKC